MPRKLREVRRDYMQAGFIEYRGKGKGSHRKYIHPLGVVATVSGKDSADAHAYQENQLKKKLAEVQNRKERQ